jgi:HSP20 family protein
MNIWTWRPGWNPLGELQRQMDRIFDFSVDRFQNLRQSWKPYPSFNLFETGKDFLLIAPLPGLKPEELDVSLANNTLTLKGERKRPADVPDEQYRRQERWVGKWSRSFQLPEKADASQIGASLEDGLLVVRMPKVLESPPRQVAVKVGNSHNSH